MTVSDRRQWLTYLGKSESDASVDGMVSVRGYARDMRPPEEVTIMEKAVEYGASAVFFEAGRNGSPPRAQAFIYVADDSSDDQAFAELHKKLWSWGRVPLLYRKKPGLVQLFRCAHGPDFFTKDGELICKPVQTLQLASTITNDPWWDSEQLRSGTIWDDTDACKTLLSSQKAAHKGLIEAVKQLNDSLNDKQILPKHLRRKLLILSLLIAYLEQREVFKDGYLGQFLPGATKFFEVLANGNALVSLLQALEVRFNGHVFSISDADRDQLRNSRQLERFSKLVEGREEAGGQLTLWQLYSFKDLPVELISHIYQLFVKDADSSVYTPPFLVRLILEETLSWDRLNRIREKGEVILDPSCGSGIFLVEAYKRLVLHWRSQNDWKKPGQRVLKELLGHIHGIDLEEGAIELAAFSLCLALCDALEPEDIRSSIKLFPRLAGDTLHHSCFFEAKEQELVNRPIGVIVGNPPFASELATQGSMRSYERYNASQGALPDKQVAYLFLHEAMEMLAAGGVLSMIQQYNFLYNQQSCEFRRRFIAKWDVREILDFISVRGLFQKGSADTKIVVVVAEAGTPPSDRKILHATFRRSGRADAEQGFDIDYYDLHWVTRELALNKDAIWRTDLLGGGRILDFIDRLKAFRTLGEFTAEQKEKHGWDFGEGFIAGEKGTLTEGRHITGKPLLEPTHLQDDASLTGLPRVKTTHFKSPYSKKRFQSPMVLIHEHEDLAARYFPDGYYTYKHKIVGISAPRTEADKIKKIASWLKSEAKPLKAFITASGSTTFTQKASWVGLSDIKALPFPESQDLDLGPNERILVDDIVDYYRDFVRLGEGSAVMRQCNHEGMSNFTQVFTRQINAIYKEKPILALKYQSWPGVICQPFVFGKGKVDWDGAEELKEKLNRLLREQRESSLQVTRISRIYDGNFMFLLKPDRLRYWLPSIALRDSDETLADLRAQGF